MWLSPMPDKKLTKKENNTQKVAVKAAIVAAITVIVVSLEEQWRLQNRSSDGIERGSGRHNMQEQWRRQQQDQRRSIKEQRRSQ